MTKTLMVTKEVEKACLINMDGDIVVNPDDYYDIIYFPSNGLCQVERDGKAGFINMEGEVVIPLKYKGTYAFSESGLAFVVCENDLGGYINRKGQFVIDPIYDTGSVFEGGMAAVSRNDEYMFIDENGLQAIDCTFKYASGFTEHGLAKVVRHDGRHQFIDYAGKVVLSLKPGCELESFAYDASVTTCTANGKKALVNKNGEIITDLVYDDIIISSISHLHQFLRDGLWGYIDNEGKEVIPNMYVKASEFTDYEIAQVHKVNPIAPDEVSSFYINIDNRIIEPRLVESFNRSFDDHFTHVYRFVDGLALAFKKTREIEMEWQHDVTYCIEEELLEATLNDSDKNEVIDEENNLVEYVEVTDETVGDKSVKNLQYVIEMYFELMDLEEIREWLGDEFGHHLQIITIRDNYAEIIYPLTALIEPNQVELFMCEKLCPMKLVDYSYYPLET